MSCTLESTVDQTEIDPPSAPPIDFAKKYKDIVRITMYAHGKKIRSMGYLPDDVMQYIFVRMIQRQSGPGRFDPTRGNFFRYVRMVTGCLVLNYHRLHARWAKDKIGMHGYDADDHYTYTDVAELADQMSDPDALGADQVLERLEGLSDSIAEIRDSFGPEEEAYARLRLIDEVGAQEAQQRCPRANGAGVERVLRELAGEVGDGEGYGDFLSSFLA